MNGSRAVLQDFVSSLGSMEVSNQVQVVVCPPFVYLPEMQSLLAQQNIVKLGAQDVSAEANGAYTGQISANMLQEYGCSYVLVGHSERRQYCGEQDAEIIKKLNCAGVAGITPVLCIGESKKERDNGMMKDVIARQLQELLELFAHQQSFDIIVAYEPCWAIGTGVAASLSDIEQAHDFIDSILQQRIKNYKILYGGSVNSGNVGTILKIPKVDGVLVGGASLSSSEFSHIGEIAAGITND